MVGFRKKIGDMFMHKVARLGSGNDTWWHLTKMQTVVSWMENPLQCRFITTVLPCAKGLLLSLDVTGKHCVQTSVSDDMGMSTGC